MDGNAAVVASSPMSFRSYSALLRDSKRGAPPATRRRRSA